MHQFYILKLFLRKRKILIFVLFPILLSGCAQMLPLSGGDKDVTPPKVIRQIPQNGQLDFLCQVLEIEFDEFIQVKDIQNQLIVSPQPLVKPDIEVKGKKLILVLKDTLKPKTTYQINFGNSVADLNEGNVLQNFSLVFSTGNYLDSLSLSGNVTDAFTKKSVSDAGIFIYRNGDDSACFTSKPDYFTKTDKSGYYRLDYLSPGNYQVVCFTDKNKNFVFDPNEELIDQWVLDQSETISINKNLIKDFEVYKDPGEKFFIRKKNQAEYGMMQFVLNRSIQSPVVESGFNKEVLPMFSRNNDTLILYYTKEIPDTVTMKLYEGQKFLQTLQFNRPESEKYETDLKRGMLNPKVSSLFEQINDSAVFVVFNTAIKKINRKKILINAPQEKIDLMKIDSVTPTLFKFYFSPEVTNGEIIFLPGALETWLGFSNDSIKNAISLRNKSTTGILKLKLESQMKGSVILQLLNESSAIVFENYFKAFKALEYGVQISGLPAGNYKMRVIEDIDSNKKWTSGNFLLKKKPEKIFYNDKLIEIFAEWETSIDWKIESE